MVCMSKAIFPWVWMLFNSYIIPKIVLRIYALIGYILFIYRHILRIYKLIYSGSFYKIQKVYMNSEMWVYFCFFMCKYNSHSHITGYEWTWYFCVLHLWFLSSNIGLYQKI